MKVQDLLDHYSIRGNPFHQEDAQEDPVFRNGCIAVTRHPAWDKIFGSLMEPSSSVVFGEKGSGKTALRLQMAYEIQQHNRKHPEARAFLVEYDDFNSFLDAFLRRGRALKDWELRDHMDAILSLGTRRLVDMILAGSPAGDPDAIGQQQLAALGRLEKRDLLLLAAIYDRSTKMTSGQRFGALRRKLGFHAPATLKAPLLGLLITVVAVVGLAGLWHLKLRQRFWVWALVAAGVAVLGWLPFLFRRMRSGWRAHTVGRQIRVLDPASADLRHAWNSFADRDLEAQPIEHLEGTDSRYVLLNKLREVLAKLGFRSLIVLVDRVDEPHALSGQAEAMHRLMRSIFDLKFLKHPGLGVKLLLPRELYAYVHRESPEFHERARLDKQNLIPSLEWSGQSLYDLASERLAVSMDGRVPAGAGEGAGIASTGVAASGSPPPVIRILIEDSITDDELVRLFDRLRTPRNLFKFLYQLLIAHAQKHTTERPAWKIERETLHTTYALFYRELDRSSVGMAMG